MTAVPQTSPSDKRSLIAELDAFGALPPASLDPVLDAAARCFARYGVRRTSVRDIADEMGVNRTTVYRQVGNVEQMVVLLARREMVRTLAEMPARLTGHSGPLAMVELMANLIDEAREHPVLQKMLADERELIASLVVAESNAVLARWSQGIAALIATYQKGSGLEPRDPAILAEWLLRIGATCVMTPPPGDLRKFLAEILVPALTPQQG